MSDINNLTGDVLGLDTNPNAPAESLAAGSKSRNPTAKNMGRTVKSRLSQAAEKSNPTAGTEDQSDDDEDEDDPQIIDCLRTAGKQGDEEDADVKARSKMLKEALEAQVAGNSAKADQILAKIQLKMVTTAAAPAKNVVTVAKRARIKEGGNDRVKENGFVFYKAEVNSFLGLGLPPFFDKNMKELKGKLSPEIDRCNEKWQDAAILHYSEKKARLNTSSDEKDRYTGLKYPSEWEQTFGDWTLNHRGFYESLSVIYNYPTLARWLLQHKANTDRIHLKDGYMAALRYDVHLRTNAFAHRVTVNGEEAFPDISVFRPDIAEEAYTDTRRFDELSFKDNPYAPGGPQDGMDPVTGMPKGKNCEAFSNPAFYPGYQAQGMPYQPQPGFGYPPAQQPPSFHPMQQPFFQPFGVPAQAQTGPPRFGGPVRDHLVNKEEDEEGTEGTGEIRV
ncbi:hypothetical protein PTTG_02857 [Puccinia triticina 1-1 BBBD Race 1]|uniref:Uncharacterized protein n=1 Tax=Puccinia triticina (isolate 1-1 / race 1 (BBBD)) TaxID=630390 RepID=A0A180GJV8_PUCT1|nr:hypothetical protein PTTG_02857 [Puccinia triticina 1-1 BBBD Race 1]